MSTGHLDVVVSVALLVEAHEAGHAVEGHAAHGGGEGGAVAGVASGAGDRPDAPGESV